MLSSSQQRGHASCLYTHSHAVHMQPKKEKAWKDGTEAVCVEKEILRKTTSKPFVYSATLSGT